MALRRAKEDARAGIVLPDNLQAIIKTETGWKNRVSIGGKMVDSGDGCDFPKGSDVTIRPVMKGRTLQPRQYIFNDLTASDWSKNFLVK